MAKIRVFLDADVIVAAVISRRGASYQLLKRKNILLVTSRAVRKEVVEVSDRLKLVFSDILLNETEVRELKVKKSEIISRYGIGVSDIGDAHVVGGAHLTKSIFLVTYNTKHFHCDLIKDKFGIIVMKPGMFLQYLRSRKSKN